MYVYVPKDVDTSDTELLIYATSLINKCLNNAPDRDLYYDHVDALQEQGIDDIIKLYMAKQVGPSVVKVIQFRSWNI